MDPYTYESTNILKNKLNISNTQTLINVEAQLIIANALDLDVVYSELNFQTYKSLQVIHQSLFKELYLWAGKFRTIDIKKSEEVLSGLSVTYSDAKEIVTDLESVFTWSKKIKWNDNNQNLVENFARLMTEIWRIHPFREGNTRTTSVFMHLFAKEKGLEFRGEILTQHLEYLRKALVLAAVEEAPEPVYLLNILTDALHMKNIKHD